MQTPCQIRGSYPTGVRNSHNSTAKITVHPPIIGLNNRRRKGTDIFLKKTPKQPMVHEKILSVAPAGNAGGDQRRPFTPVRRATHHQKAGGEGWGASVGKAVLCPAAGGVIRCCHYGKLLGGSSNTEEWCHVMTQQPRFWALIWRK